jgi:hypothetical protein
MDAIFGSIKSRLLPRLFDGVVLFVTVATFACCGKANSDPVAQSSPSGLQATPHSSSSGADNNNYELGTVVRFGTGGGSERFRQSGWSNTENEFTWSIGNSAKLFFSIPSANQSLTLRMRLTGLTKSGELPMQPVEVFANGRKIADWEVSSTADFTAVVPAAIVKPGGVLTIELRTPKATSPKVLGMNDDPRVLAVRCSELAIGKSP